MSVVYRYLMIIVACTSLLIGLQVPSFVDQYQKRVDAHLREVLGYRTPHEVFFGVDLRYTKHPLVVALRD